MKSDHSRRAAAASWAAPVVLGLLASQAHAASGTWSSRPATPAPVAQHAVGVVNGKLYAVGGGNPASCCNLFAAPTYEFDPAANAWSTKTSMSVRRKNLGAAVVNGILYAVGGDNDLTRFNTNEAYNPATDTWSPRAPMPTPRSFPTVVALNGLVYAIGGENPSGLTTVEAYDPSTNSWSARAPLPQARSRIAGTAVVNGILYVMGGVDLASGTVLSSVEAYDPALDVWTSRAPMPAPRAAFGAAAMSGIIYAVGGVNSTFTAVSTVDAYDPASNSWTSAPPMATPRWGLGVAALGESIYAVGGYNTTYTGAVEAFTPLVALTPPPPFSQLVDTPAGECVCTPISNLADQETHEWFARADSSGQLQVTVVGVAGFQNNPNTVIARVFDMAGADLGQVSVSIPSSLDDNEEVRASGSFAATPGEVYRIRVALAAENTSNARYWLKFVGARMAGANSLSPTLENGATQWLFNVDSADPLSVVVSTELLGQPPAGTTELAYQWIAPGGQAGPVEVMQVNLPGTPGFVTASIPPPASVVAGIWRLRVNFEFHYRVGKTSGLDRGVYQDKDSGGRGTLRINLVDGQGDPFFGPVDLALSILTPAFAFQIGGSVQFDHVEAFAYGFHLTPPAGFVASITDFDLFVACDKTAEVTITIAPPPPTPPSLSVRLSPGSLWPPNHKMVPVAATIEASSPSGHATRVELMSVLSSEPDFGQGDGDTANDIQGATIGVDDRAFALRAERSGSGPGRIYTATYRATDLVTGATATATATVVVPHDKGR